MKSLSLSSRVAGSVAALLFACISVTTAEESPEALPEPLTLEYALSLAHEPHPQVQRAQAALETARAELQAAQARTDIDTGIEAAARWIQPPEFLADQGNQDHRLALTARKRLFDFGRTKALTTAAASEVEAGQWRLVDARAQRRLEILERYVDVLLADMEYARDNEAMAVSFVTFDRVKERQDLGQQSEIEVLEAAAGYQEIRRRRFESQARQRTTRARLALALNRPTQLSTKLLPPDLQPLKREIPELAALEKAALQNNPGLVALRTRVEAARQRLSAARAGKRPYIDAEAGVGAYTRELGSNNLFSGGVTLNVPLYQGGRIAALIAGRQADITRLQAELATREYEVRQAVLETWLTLDSLKAQREEMQALVDYREMYLDRARTLYDQEVRADLGDAMVEYTNATLRKARADYQTLLEWARLDALTGKTNGESSETIKARVTDDNRPVGG